MKMKKTDCSPVFRPTPPPMLHRFYHVYAGVDRKAALNCTTEAGSSAQDIIFDLRQAINAIKLDAFDMEAGTVDYGRLKDSPAYASYRQTTQRLQSFSLDTLSSFEECLAFWVNLYNTLIVDAVIHYKVQKTVQEVRGFFVKAAYIIDGYRFSADDIEHGVLRVNAGHPAIPGPQFKFSDPRLKYALKDPEPRIHFALVCASESCPPVGVYDADRIDEQLTAAAYNFINGGEVQVDVDHYTVTLSRTFQWYAPDFGGSVFNQMGRGNFSAILSFISPYLAEENAKTALQEHPERFRVRFKDYNWGLNLLA